MNKVKLTKEVAEQIESLRKSLHSNREIINAHRLVLGKGGWPSPRSPLNQIDVHTLQQAVMFGYEIDEPSGKITKFSDIKLGMLVKPLKDHLPSGIIEVIDDEDKSFRFTGGRYGHWGWEYELGIDWEIVDTALELPVEETDGLRGINCRNAISPPNLAVEDDDTTDLKPNDYRSMVDIALMTRDEDWLKDILQKIKGVAK